MYDNVSVHKMRGTENSIQAKMIADQQGHSDNEIEAQIRRRLETSSSPIAQW